MCFAIKTLNTLVSFVAFDSAQHLNELKELQCLNYNNLTGAEVWDYVNPVTHPNEKDHLIDFFLERQIPIKGSKAIEAVFYLAIINKKRGKKLRNTQGVVIIPVQADNFEYLDNQFTRLNNKKSKTDPAIHRFAKNGFINGRPTPFLAIEIGRAIFDNNVVEGLSPAYIAYTNFNGEEIILTSWERIRIDDKPVRPHFHSLLLRDYSQDPEVNWGSFKCK